LEVVNFLKERYLDLIIGLVQYFLAPERRTIKYYTKAAISAFFVMVFALAGFLTFGLDLDSVRKLKDYTPPSPSKLYDRKGRLITLFIKENRIIVDIANTPPHLTQAFVAMEDNHFFTHYGIDPQAILRAALKNLAAGYKAQGGSTITQQLAKIILTDRSRTYTRKFKEAFLSLYLDYYFTKEEILNLYFNQIYLGHGNYGVEAASRFYFNKPVSEISIAEAAILASLPSAPENYSPVKYPHRSRQKALQALFRMVDLGFITPETLQQEYENLIEYYMNLNISPASTAFGNRTDNAPYYTEYVRQILEEKFGKEVLYEEGLNIYCGLDLDHQYAAQKALWNGLKEQMAKGIHSSFTKQLEFQKEMGDITEVVSLLFDLPEFELKRSLTQYETQLYYYSELEDTMEILNLALGGDYKVDRFIEKFREANPYIYSSLVQGALVEIDHKTGEITAMVGGTPFNAVNQINRAMNIKRQPGSTFKPLIYVTALEEKSITAASIFPDTPNIFLDLEGDYWIPENYSGGYRGFVTIREAINNSINMVSIAIARETGIKKLIPYISRILHVPEKSIPSNFTLALGSYEVSPIQMARAFSLFPRGGRDINPLLIKKVTNQQGEVIYTAPDEEEREILSAAAAEVMTQLLSSVVEEGTGKSIRRIGYTGFAAGKTGTTNNFRDAWFVGFNDRYTSSVWVGYDKPTVSLGAGQSGGSISAPIWGYFQFYVAPYRRGEAPHMVEGAAVPLEICKTNGKLATEECTEIITEYFIPGTEPTESEEVPVSTIIEQSGIDTETDEKNADDNKTKIDQNSLSEDIF